MDVFRSVIRNEKVPLNVRRHMVAAHEAFTLKNNPTNAMRRGLDELYEVVENYQNRMNTDEPIDPQTIIRQINACAIRIPMSVMIYSTNRNEQKDGIWVFEYFKRLWAKKSSAEIAYY